MDQLWGDWTLMLAEVVASVRRVAVRCAVVWPLGRTVAVGRLPMETGGMMETGCGPSWTTRPTDMSVPSYSRSPQAMRAGGVAGALRSCSFRS